MIYGYFTLLVALIISSIAEYYSIIGLTAIFSSAFWPIVIMGAALGVGKITAAVWLKLNWHRASWVYKMYLVPAVAILMLLTSIGCFGYLSKAHSDSGLVSGDVQAKIAVYDEKIKTEKENIEANRKALKQMDEGVDQVLGRSTTETGAERAVAMRKSQQKERSRIQNEISQSQKSIAELNEARAPIAAEIRNVEAEVGPLKYIAALVYGDNPDADILDKAVRLVIIIIVAVFDPLALVLILAAQQSIRWAREEKESKVLASSDIVADAVEKPIQEQEEIVDSKYEPDDGTLTEEQISQIKESVTDDVSDSELITKSELLPEEPINCYQCGTELLNAPGIGNFCPNTECVILDNTNGVEWIFVEPDDKIKTAEPEKSILEQHPYLNNGFSHFENLQPVVYKSETDPISESTVINEQLELTLDEPFNDEITADTEIKIEDIHAMEVKQDLPYRELPGGYVSFEGKHMNKDALFSMHPEFLRLSADANKPVNSSFGTKFPDVADKGDIFTRVDVLPNKVYKFDGGNWININKETSNTYLYNTKYLEYLIEVLEKGEYDPELLSENEKSQIEDYLKINKINQNR